MTRTGIKEIASLAGSSPELLTPDGWQRHPVRMFGQQPVHTITLRRLRAERVIRATSEHSWVLHGGKRTITTELRPGDRLATNVAAVIAVRELDAEWAARGFVWGDGTYPQGTRLGTLKIYRASRKATMCGLFDGLIPGRGWRNHADGWYFYGIPRDWKALPETFPSQAAMWSWLSGYFAADGSVGAASATLTSVDAASIRRVRDICAELGIRTSAPRTSVKLREIRGKEYDTPLHSVVLNVRDIPAHFWLLKHHQEAAAKLCAKKERAATWSVVHISEPSSPEPVYCATVEGSSAFTLSENLLTGNCPFFRPEENQTATTCRGHVGNTER